MNQLKNFNDLTEVAVDIRNDLKGDNRKEKHIVLLYAHNGIGKTRLSKEFSNLGKTEHNRDTLYFNAFTEDLFNWDNDLDGDEHRVLLLNQHSNFFTGIEDLDIDNKIRSILHNFTDFNFLTEFDYVKPSERESDNPKIHWAVRFIREELVNGISQNVENIKISRGEECLFIWCFFLAICQLAIDKHPSYSWVKYIYIDDPISSLDENKAIDVACGLSKIIRDGVNFENNDDKIKIIISTHHSLFFNVMFNEIKNIKHKFYYLHASKPNGYKLQDTGDSPFFHHIATLSRLKQVADTEQIYTFHFNELRTILEKTASFFGYDKINNCIQGLEDEILFERALNIFSHGKYSVFDPREMSMDNKELFKRILRGFIEKYEFYLPEIFNEEQETIA
jgi:hypothetical protein